MANIIKYKKDNNGSLTGGIIVNNNNGVETFTAVTAAKSKDYKTLKGAKKFMSNNNYIEDAVKTEDKINRKIKYYEDLLELTVDEVERSLIREFMDDLRHILDDCKTNQFRG